MININRLHILTHVFFFSSERGKNIFFFWSQKADPQCQVMDSNQDATPQQQQQRQQNTNKCKMTRGFFSHRERQTQKNENREQNTHIKWQTMMQQPGLVQRRNIQSDDCRWTLIRNALTLHELSSENADNVSLLTDPGSPSRLYLILPQHAFLVWDDKTPKYIDRQWLKSADKMSKK